MIICWDYDGTLVSSEGIYKNIFLKYLKENNFVLKDIEDDYYFSKYAGKHPFNVINILKNDGYIKQDANIDLNELRFVFENELKGNSLILTNNIEKILSEISKLEDIYMAIVTSTYREDFEAKHKNPAVKILSKYFDINKNVYICNEVGTKELKPEPNGYLFAYKDITSKVKLKSNLMFMIEDSTSGCKSAKAAKDLLKNKTNCIVVGYLVGNHFCSEKDLTNAGADVIIKTSEEMINLIKKYSKETNK